MTFYNRVEELDALDSAFESAGHNFVVVYGRRRVGKTALLKEFCTDQPHIYFLAAQEAEPRQREKFVDTVAGYFDDRVYHESMVGMRPSRISVRNSKPRRWWL